MPTGPYGLPQGITIDGQQHQAVPRKIGAFDMEGISGGSAATTNAVPSQLVYFQNATAFGQGLKLGTTSGQSKVFGRDTNITSRTGGMAKGERLYTYGITAKIDACNQALDVSPNIAAFDQWRILWGVADAQFNLGTDEFIRVQARDVPLFAPRVPFHTYTTGLTVDVSNEGMYDLTISGDPYVLDQQEDFRINLNFSINSGSFMISASAPAAIGTRSTATALVVETHITMRLEGIRLKSLRQ